jgi:hypothetical protein
MVLSIKDMLIKKIKETDLAFNSGLMGQDMKENGGDTKLMVKVNFGMQMVTFMKGNG